MGVNSDSEISNHSLNNNLLTAQENMEIWLVMVVLWTTLSNMLKITESFMKMNMPIKLLNKLVNKIQDHSKFQDILTLKIVMILLMLLPEDLSQLLLMPQTGQDIQPEFSATVKPDLIMVSS